MKIKKAAVFYTLSIPTHTNFEFFSSSSNQILYFRTLDEAKLYQKKHFAEKSVAYSTEIAVLDIDKDKNEHWNLLKKMADLSNPSITSNHHTHIYKFNSSLEETIKNNPNTVIAVTSHKNNETAKSSSCRCPRKDWVCDNALHVTFTSRTLITYEKATMYDNDITYLYVSEKEKYIVEPGHEITFVDTTALLYERDLEQGIEELRNTIAVSQNKLEALLEEQQNYQCTANSF